MADLRDQVIKAIQAYNNNLISAISEPLADVIIEELGLCQDYAVATYVTGPSGDEVLDTIEHHTDRRPDAVARMEQDIAYDEAEMDRGYLDGLIHRRIVSRIYTPWTEDVEPALDPDIVELVENYS